MVDVPNSPGSAGASQYSGIGSRARGQLATALDPAIRDTPTVTVRPVIYTVPVVTGTSPFPVPGPTFEKNFNSNGLDGVIMEIEHFGNGPVGATETWHMYSH